MNTESVKFIVYRNTKLYLILAIWFLVSGAVTIGAAAYYGTFNLLDTKIVGMFVIWTAATVFLFIKACARCALITADSNGLSGNVDGIDPVPWWRIDELLLLETKGQQFMGIVTRDGEDVLQNQSGVARSLIDYPLIPAESFASFVAENADRPIPYFIPLSILPISAENLIDGFSLFSQIRYRYI